MRNFILIFMLLISFGLKSQIGYQISLLDTATGQPRADEAVQVSLELTDNTGTIICSETKTAVSDDFGILSLTIGNSSTFDNVDWTKLPFYISASVDGVLLGKSQVLTVPVAEYAKHIGTLTKEILKSKKWAASYNSSKNSTYLTFNDNTVLNENVPSFEESPSTTYKYAIWGNFVILYGSTTNDSKHLFYTGSCLVEADGTDFK